MKNFLLPVLLLGLLLLIPDKIFAQTPAPDWIQRLPAVQSENQVIVVAGTGGTRATVSMHERNSAGEWIQILSTPGYIGSNGLGKVRAGDHKTPVGVFRIDKALGINPNPGCAIPYARITENLYWSGDWNYKYNQLVDIREYPGLDRVNSEHLIDYQPFYRYVLNMGYNSECIPGKGSALFMHCSKPGRPFTGGCVAVPEDKMLFVMRHVKPDCMIIIDSIENLGGY